jgi:hypothetical protein
MAALSSKREYFSVFSSRNVPIGLGSVLVECGYKAKNPCRSRRCKRIIVLTTFNIGFYDAFFGKCSSLLDEHGEVAGIFIGNDRNHKRESQNGG